MKNWLALGVGVGETLTVSGLFPLTVIVTVVFAPEPAVATERGPTPVTAIERVVGLGVGVALGVGVGVGVGVGIGVGVGVGDGPPPPPPTENCVCSG